MNVQVLDYDLAAAAAVAECSGQEFGKTAGTFRTKERRACVRCVKASARSSGS